jgi:hypothetical protein
MRHFRYGRDGLPEEEAPMRNLLLIATLSLATFAWAQPAASDNDMSNNRSADSDFYIQTLASQVDQSTRVNDTLTPSAEALAAQPESMASPDSMASNTESQNGAGWYDQVVQSQAGLNTRIKLANAAF